MNKFLLLTILQVFNIQVFCYDSDYRIGRVKQTVKQQHQPNKFVPTSNKSRQGSKIFLEEMMKNMNSTSKIELAPNLMGTCRIKSIEISLKIKNCGRVLFNTTSCSGYCKSSSFYITNTDYVKSTCSGCKVTRFKQENFNVKCIDGTMKNFQIKAVTKCSCFKMHDKIRKIKS